VRKFKTYLEDISDVIVTGHEHETSKRIVDNLEGNLTEYIEGHVLQDDSDDQNSGFNLLIFDVENRTHKIISFQWNGKYYSRGEIDEKWIPYSGSCGANRRMEITSEFSAILSDAGASFNHPQKSDLLLDDIFVFPTLRNLRVQKTKETEVLHDTVSASTLSTLDPNRVRILLIGEEKSGRTSLCSVHPESRV
jgi:hypothetical protein